MYTFEILRWYFGLIESSLKLVAFQNKSIQYVKNSFDMASGSRF